MKSIFDIQDGDVISQAPYPVPGVPVVVQFDLGFGQNVVVFQIKHAVASVGEDLTKKARRVFSGMLSNADSAHKLGAWIQRELAPARARALDAAKIEAYLAGREEWLKEYQIAITENGILRDAIQAGRFDLKVTPAPGPVFDLAKFDRYLESTSASQTLPRSVGIFANDLRHMIVNGAFNKDPS